MHTLPSILVSLLYVAFSHALPVEKDTSLLDSSSASSKNAESGMLDLRLGPSSILVKDKHLNELNLFPLQAVSKSSLEQALNHPATSPVKKVSPEWLSLGITKASSSSFDTSWRDGPSKAGPSKQGESSISADAQRRQRKAAFWTEYERQNLGRHLPEEVLAEKVRSIGPNGRFHQWVSYAVKKRLRETGASKEYIANFRRFTRQLSYKVGGAKKILGKDVADEVLVEHVKGQEKKSKERSRPRTWSQKQRQQKANQDALTAQIGESFEAFFKSKHLDIDKMTAKQVEEISRELPIIGPKCRFARSLNAYLASKRPLFNLNEYRSYREDHNRSQQNAKHRRGRL